ncbi:MAG TPA: hypothetical protein VHS96_06505 [Bacteroidia bacterium]|nr:hypothetical protein [Bacteroidia bacterium]
MNTRLESLLAALTAGLLLMFLTLIATNVFGQDRFLCAIGTSMPQANTLTEGFPQLQRTATDDALRLSGKDFAAAYDFEKGRLTHLQIARSFQKEDLAKLSLEVHLNFIRRNGASVVKIHSDRQYSLYSAMDETAVYELSLDWDADGGQQLTIHAWQRATDQEPAEASLTP